MRNKNKIHNLLNPYQNLCHFFYKQPMHPHYDHIQLCLKCNKNSFIYIDLCSTFVKNNFYIKKVCGVILYEIFFDKIISINIFLKIVIIKLEYKITLV